MFAVTTASSGSNQRALVRLFERLPSSLFLALRNLTRQFRRSAASLLSVAFGVSALLAAGGFTSALFTEFREATIASLYGHVQVSRPGFQERGRSDPWQYLLPAAPPVIEGLPQGARITPRLLLNGLASFGDQTQPFTAEAINPTLDMRDDRSLVMQSGRRLQGDSSRELIVGAGLAARLGVTVGENLVLLANTQGGQLGAVEGQVVGVFSSFSKEFDDAALYMPIDLGRSLMKVEGAHAWLVYLENSDDTSEASATLRATLGDGYVVHPWRDLAEFYTRAAELFTQQLAVIKLVVVVIILLGIGNTMMSSVMERTGEIGTRLALGAKRREVLRDFLVEGATLGFLGAILGCAAAFGLSGLLELVQVQMPPPPSFSRGYVARLELGLPLLLEAILIAVVTTTLATVYPAYRASRMVIVDAIRSAR